MQCVSSITNLDNSTWTTAPLLKARSAYSSMPYSRTISPASNRALMGGLVSLPKFNLHILVPQTRYLVIHK
ncbi:hypothetical protein PILCRDRAFT_824321 [Piloderma croceum F 1598]|uniref:Uncharacterized protein n=1 Tax=Piloderma croceum (strain F 1598) TaxID=765440 RepID=A0A0C3F0X3_PILCF|nr:hypothetical protein PILCRDRAFT_824321 [Piloderma croceum F 1598]